MNASTSKTGIAVEGRVRATTTRGDRIVDVVAYGRDWFEAVATFKSEVEVLYGPAAIAPYAAGHAKFDRTFAWMNVVDKAGTIERSERVSR